METKKSHPWVWILFGIFALVIGVPLATCGTCATYTVVGTKMNSHPTLRRGEKCESSTQCEGSLKCVDSVCK